MVAARFEQKKIIREFFCCYNPNIGWYIVSFVCTALFLLVGWFGLVGALKESSPLFTFTINVLVTMNHDFLFCFDIRHDTISDIV